MTKYGAYHRRTHDDIIWFRTSQNIAVGSYMLKSHHGEAPDVYIAESVPALIMHVTPWIDAEEAEFQQENAAPEMNQAERASFASRLTEQLISQLDPNNDKIWLDEPRWLKKLRRFVGIEGT